MSGARRLMLGGVGLTALLALVAVASRAHKPGGGSGAAAANPPQLLWEYGASIMVVLLPLGTIVMFWGLAYSRRQKVLAGERNWRRTAATLLAMIPFLVGGYFVVRHFRAPPPPRTITTPPNAPSRPQKNAKSNRTPSASLKPPAQPKFQWLAALIFGSLILATVVTIAGMVYWRRLHGEEWDQEAAMLEAIDEVLADSLDDLRAEKDPRRAVIRTYARMERTFAAYGVPREESEVPQEYVGRVLDRLGVSISAVRRLTDLFSRAKFSPHTIDAGMKDQAIDALVGLRAELEHKEGEEVAA
jgi:hypothetical protein